MRHIFLGMSMLLVFAACSEMEDIEFAEQNEYIVQNWIDEELYYVQMTLEGPTSTNEFCLGDEINVMLNTNIPPSDINTVYYLGGFGTDYSNEEAYSSKSSFTFNGEDYSGGEYMYAIKPGHWNVQVCIYTKSGRYVDSNVKPIVINFPEISEDDGWLFWYDFEEIWSKTLSVTDQDGKYEMGAWMYANLYHGSLEYGIDMDWLIEGGNVGPCERGFISNSDIQDALDEKIPSLPWGPADAEIKFVVAYFHTHTPLTYCESDEAIDRYVGISEGDESWANSYKIPIFVYDYEGEAFSGNNGYILNEHPLDMNAKFYFYNQVTQRETPQKDYTETLIKLTY